MTNLSWNSSIHGTVQLIRGYTSERAEVEQRLLARGIVLPAPQQARWQAADGLIDTLLLVLRDSSGQPVHAMGVAVERSRAMPGHRLYRIERYAAGSSPVADQEILSSLANLVRQDSLGLRAVIEVFDKDSAARSRLGEIMLELGFVRSPQPRMYEQTLAVELRGTEEELFARLDKTARRHVRAASKRGFDLRPITDPSLAPRIQALMEEAFRRTNATGRRHHWVNIIDLSVRHPDVSLVVGLFDPAKTGAKSLVSVAWGCAHGDYATYEAGAAARGEAIGSMPLSYAPVWHLITWALKHTRANWFDLGGVSTRDLDESRAGILKFKRYFSETVVDVGEEWILEPHKTRAAIARVVSTVARNVSARRAAMNSRKS